MEINKLKSVFKGIKQRCHNANSQAYKYYGGKGVKCEWETFADFYNDMGKSYKVGLSIDRIDSNGNYSKDNCRWTTAKVQANNKSPLKTKQKLLLKNFDRDVEIYKLVKSGKTLQSIGDTYKISKERVRQIVLNKLSTQKQKNNLTKLMRSGYSLNIKEKPVEIQARDKAIIFLYHVQGYPLSVISKLFNLSRVGVFKIVKKK